MYKRQGQTLDALAGEGILVYHSNTAQKKMCIRDRLYLVTSVLGLLLTPRKLIAHALEQGKSAIVLVPEIGLTPQLSLIHI